MCVKEAGKTRQAAQQSHSSTSEEEPGGRASARLSTAWCALPLDGGKAARFFSWPPYGHLRNRLLHTLVGGISSIAGVNGVVVVVRTGSSY